MYLLKIRAAWKTSIEFSEHRKTWSTPSTRTRVQTTRSMRANTAKYWPCAPISQMCRSISKPICFTSWRTWRTVCWSSRATCRIRRATTAVSWWSCSRATSSFSPAIQLFKVCLFFFLLLLFVSSSSFFFYYFYLHFLCF